MKDEQSDPGGIWRLKQSANLRRITADAQPSDSFHERMAEHAASIMKGLMKVKAPKQAREALRTATL